MRYFTATLHLAIKGSRFWIRFIKKNAPKLIWFLVDIYIWVELSPIVFKLANVIDLPTHGQSGGFCTMHSIVNWNTRNLQWRWLAGPGVLDMNKDKRITYESDELCSEFLISALILALIPAWPSAWATDLNFASNEAFISNSKPALNAKSLYWTKKFESKRFEQA